MMKLWQNYMASWLDRRIPSARQFSLGTRNIFIFPSGFGWLFLLLNFALFLLGTNYQNNLMLMLSYFLSALFLICLFSTYMNFARLKVKLGKTQNVFAGDQLPLPLWFHHYEDDQQHASGLLEIRFWQEKPCLQIDLDAFSNPVTLAYDCSVRGPLSLPRITLTSLFPLGLFRCWTHLKFDSDIVVYPKPVPCAIALQNTLVQQQESQHSQGQQGHEDFDSLKAYQLGEPLHHVSWKHLAKGRGMISKQFSSNVSTSGWLSLLPCATDELEQKLGQLCFQVLELSRSDTVFGLDLGQTKIEPASGNQHQRNCLIALAMFNRERK